MIWGSLIAAGGSALTGLGHGVYPLTLGFALASLGFGLFRPGFTAGASLAVGPDEQNEVAGQVTSVNGVAYVAGPALGVAVYSLGLPLPFLATAALMLGLAFWTARRAGPSALRPARGEHARRDEADPAAGAPRLLLQLVLDLVIVALHLLGHRGAGVEEGALEIGHRHFLGLDRFAQREQAGAADQILEIGAGEAL